MRPAIHSTFSSFGCVQMFHDSQAYFRQAVILLIATGSQVGWGSVAHTVVTVPTICHPLALVELHSACKCMASLHMSALLTQAGLTSSPCRGCLESIWAV